MRKLIAVLCTGALVCSIGCAQKVSPDVAVTVDGKKITKSQIMRVADVYREQMVRMQPQRAMDAMGSEIFKGAARQLIANELLLKEAKKRGLSSDTARINKTVAQFKSSAPDEAAFQRELTKMGETDQSMRQQIADGIVIDSLVKQVVASSTDSITEDESKQFYEKNKDKYVSQPSVQVSQLLFPFDSSASAALRKQIMDKANTALAEVKSGKNIDVIVKKNAKSPGTAIGGDMGWFQRGDLRPDVEQAVSQLKVSDVSDVITTDNGYLIVKKTGEKQGELLTYDKVQSHIKMSLELKKRNDKMVTFIESLMSKAKIVYNDTTYKPTAEMISGQSGMLQ